MINTAFYDLPLEAFPFKIQAFRDDTGEEVWNMTVTEPCSIEIPALKEHFGVSCSIRMEFANGRIIDARTGFDNKVWVETP